MLEIGAVPRGRATRSPAASNWIVADIVPAPGVDIILDVCDMGCIRKGSIDTIKANEVLEHVASPERALSFWFAALRDDGFLFLTVPFMHRVHADPTDYQRWTESKCRLEIAAAGFEIVHFEVLGSFFSLLGDMAKTFANSLPRGLRKPVVWIVSPALSWMRRLDQLQWTQAKQALSTYHTGYFFALRKPNQAEGADG